MHLCTTVEVRRATEPAILLDRDPSRSKAADAAVHDREESIRRQAAATAAWSRTSVLTVTMWLKRIPPRVRTGSRRVDWQR